MGRNAKPTAIHLAEGNPNRLTKEQIAARQEAEVKLGENDLKKLRKPKFVSQDKTASKLWGDLIKEYISAAQQGVELLTSSDVGMLALYCKTFSEYENLLASYQSIGDIRYDSDGLDEHIEDSEEFDYKVKMQLRTMLSVDALLRIETAINKKMDMLLKMQDRLFLNPLAKVKNIPKSAKKKEDAPVSKFSKFGGGNR